MAGGALKLFTSSYDGSMRCLDPSTGSFQLVVSSEEAEFSAMDCTADGNVAILGDNDGYLHIYDIRFVHFGDHTVSLQIIKRQANLIFCVYLYVMPLNSRP
jgi:hypothetical protein